MSELGKISIRRAGTSDLDAVARVWHESASKMDGILPHLPSREALRQRIDAELECGWDLHVALRGEKIVGMLALKPPSAIVDQIFVLPNEQGRGVGRALLDVAKQLMAGGFTLRMDSANEKARRFYEAEGMKKLEEGIHPWTGIPVYFYRWSAGGGSGADIGAGAGGSD